MVKGCHCLSLTIVQGFAEPYLGYIPSFESMANSAAMCGTTHLGPTMFTEQHQDQGLNSLGSAG